MASSLSSVTLASWASAWAGRREGEYRLYIVRELRNSRLTTSRVSDSTADSSGSTEVVTTD